MRAPYTFFEGGTDTLLYTDKIQNMHYLMSFASTNLNVGKFYFGENRNDSYGASSGDIML